MCEDSETPARHDINISPEDQASRRFTSFYISDILGEQTEANGTQRQTFEENRPLEVNSPREEAIDQPSKACSRHDSNKPCPSTATKPAAMEEDIFSNLKSRSPFLAEQREVLEKTFHESKYISSRKRKQLSLELGLTERQIKTWFQNRRTKFRRIRGSDGLRRQDTWGAEHGGDTRVLSNIDGGINGLPKDWVLSLYRLLSKR